MPYIRIFITLFLAFSAIFTGFLYAAYALKTTNYIAFQLLASANILLMIAFFLGVCLR